MIASDCDYTNFKGMFTYYGGAFRSGVAPMRAVAAEPVVTSLAVSYYDFMRVCSNNIQTRMCG
jgi:hypothetical protein